MRLIQNLKTLKNIFSKELYLKRYEEKIKDNGFPRIHKGDNKKND